MSYVHRGEFEPDRSARYPTSIARAREIARCSRQLRKFNWETVGSADLPMIFEDPRHWDFLLSSSQAGDRCAFRVLLKDFDAVLQDALGRVLPCHLVDHAISDILLTVAQKLRTSDPKGSILSWLFAITVYRLTHPREWQDALGAKANITLRA